MPDESSTQRDLVLAPNEYALISDQTKGKIDVCVGPYKSSLAGTDQPVVFDSDTKKFLNVHLEKAIKLFKTAPEGWYLNLKNPAADGGAQPKPGNQALPDLDIGRKINVAGPVSFPLWPGQMVRVIKGHHLRSNQFLLARVYDEEAAKENWGAAVIKAIPQGDETEKKTSKSDEKMPNFTMGKLIVIKGTDVSFYMPPTGIEVVKDERGELVRDAETLEKLEYCVLLNENGNKRYVRGPDVVFPEPTENFLVKNGSRKFKATELNEISGLYIKVIAEYEKHGVGDELFITGKDQMIYFPREEHAIIKYGDQDVHYAVAVPAGEARYLLNRMTGEISIVEGPDVILPDPRTHVFIRRMLDPKTVKLWFPGNKDAMEYNADLQRVMKSVKSSSDGYLSEDRYMTSYSTKGSSTLLAATADAALVGDDFERSETFTPPRTVTLDTKYDGTIDIDVWTGYAVLVVAKSGSRRVVVGPDTIHLAYDESLEAFELSTGTPKTTDNTMRAAYLRVLNNKVSDLVRAETKDLCKMDIKLSYLVNFEGDKERWFNVENYVKFLTDHLRSVIKGVAKNYTIEEFYGNSTQIIRDFVLGEHRKDAGRKGKFFPENGMRVHDVEVLAVTIKDDDIEELLITNQYEIVEQNLSLAKEQRDLAKVKQEEICQRQKNAARSSTVTNLLALKKTENTVKISKLETDKDVEAGAERIVDMAHAADLARNGDEISQGLAKSQAELDLKKEETSYETQAVVEKTKAVSPDLIAAMAAIGDKALLEKVSESFSLLSILGGKSLADVAGNIFKGTKLDGLIEKVTKKLKK